MGLLLVAAGSLAACGSGGTGYSSGGAATRATASGAPNRSIAGVMALPPSGLHGAPMLDTLSTIAIRWGGTQVGQDPNPLVPTPYTITSATHPLANAYLKNPLATPQTFSIDMFIATEPPPPAFYSAAIANPIPYQQWPGGVWDWAASRSSPGPASVVVPANTTVVISLDWPQRLADGTAATAGRYWAVIRAVAPSGLVKYLTPEEATPLILSR